MTIEFVVKVIENGKVISEHTIASVESDKPNPWANIASEDDEKGDDND